MVEMVEKHGVRNLGKEEVQDGLLKLDVEEVGGSKVRYAK